MLDKWHSAAHALRLVTRKVRQFDSVRAGPARAAGEGVGRVHCRRLVRAAGFSYGTTSMSTVTVVTDH